MGTWTIRKSTPRDADTLSNFLDAAYAMGEWAAMLPLGRQRRGGGYI